MVGKRPKLISSLLVAVTVAGCSHLGKAVIGGSLERPDVYFKTGGVVSRLLHCVTEATVTNQDQVLWRIRSDDGECVNVGRLQYGVTPSGFTQESEAAPLREGVRYGAGASGWTRGFASVPFMASGNFIFEDGKWREASGR